MPPTLYFVRHAEGEHNVEDRHHLRDPLITELGKEQCRQLREKFQHHDKISLVIASPLQRTIQTASFCFDSALQRPDVSFILLPIAQEIGGKACDIGHERAELRKSLPHILSEGKISFDPAKIDFSMVEDGWNSKKGIYEPSLSAVEKRAATLRSWLWQRPEPHIVVVTHGAFLHYLIEDWSLFDLKKGTAFENCEVRLFTFTEDSNENEAHLLEHGKNTVKQRRPPGIHSTVLSEIEEIQGHL